MPLVTWPDVIGLRTVAGGVRLLRDDNFNLADDVATWADAGGERVLRGG